MTDKIKTESTYKVWNLDEPVSITIGEDADGLDMVRVYTETKEDKEYWGEIDFVMNTEQALAFANAILKKVKEIRESL